MKNAKSLKKRLGRLFITGMNHQLKSWDFFKIGFVFLFMVQSLLASGIVKGRVLDRQSGEALPAANILVKGTNVGTAADLDGNYFINYVPSGQQILEVTYIGYERIEATVTVPEDGIVTQDLMLSPVAVKGETVVITGQAASQGAAINQQIASNTITNVVSSSKIRELPDESAAAALSRLPGVSLMDGDKVSIRGIQAKQNLVLVNGIQLPSTDMEDRSTNLGFFSSNMLAGIEVTKVVTPNMDANAIGGVVNLRLREAPTGMQYDLFTQGSFNAHDRTYPGQNFKVWGSVSNRFFNDKLGIFIQGNADRSNVGNDEATAGYVINDDSAPYGEADYLMGTFVFLDEENIITNYGGSVFLDYALPNGKIILQNALAHTINDMARYRQEYDFAVTEAAYALNRDKHNKELLINALQFNYNFGPIIADLGLSHSFSDKATDVRYGDPGNEFGFQNVQADTTFIDNNGAPITYDVTRRYLTPEDVFDIKLKSDDWENAPIYGWCVTRTEAFKQHLYNGNLDFTIPLSLLNAISGDIKLGGKFTRSVRNNDVEAAYRRTGDNDFYNGVLTFFGADDTLHVQNNPLLFSDIRNNDYDRGKYFFEGDYEFLYALDKEKMDEFIPNAVKGWLKSRHEANSLRDDFEGSELFTAAYIMGDFNIGPRLSLIGGGRFEHFNMDYTANFVYCTHSVDGDANEKTRTIERNDDTFFPNAQIRYKFTEWGDIRAAYSKTISRPDYMAILPNVYYENGGGVAAGNSNLKPAVANNIDVYMSLYNNEIGLLTIGGFYKKIDDVFFRTEMYYPFLSHYGVSCPDSAGMVDAGLNIIPSQVPGQSTVTTTYVNNPNPAYIRGFELDWQTYFWYLPKPFNTLVLSANYTKSWSEMDYQQLEREDSSYSVVVNGRTKYYTKYKTVERVRNMRLLGQADDVVNIAIGVNHKGFAGRLSFRYTGEMLSSAGVRRNEIGIRPEDDLYTRPITRWDISITQKLPIKGLLIGFEGVNIFHSPEETYKIFRRAAGEPIIENLVTTRYIPRKFSLYLRYNFE